MPPKPQPEIDQALERLAGHREAWVRVPVSERIEYLRLCIGGVAAAAPAWVAEAARRRGIDPGSPLAGEEWIAGPMTTVRYARLLVRALGQDGQPRPPALRGLPGGQLVARVFPVDGYDRLLYAGIHGEIRIRPGRKPTQGRIYRDKAAGRPAPGRLALVLGAGNVSSIPPLDLLYKLFVENEVVLLKMNPVNAYLGPFFEPAFAPLIRDGFLKIVYGDAEIGGYLCHHPRVETIHLTGSDRTYDAIVWGADGATQATRRAEGRPLLDKPVSAELGCVSPILVVPGPWSSSDLEFQAQHVAGMISHNASFNCNAGKVLVLARDWSQRSAFLDRVRAALAATPPRVAYYPGAERRYRDFLEQYPQAVRLGAEGEGVVPWTLIPDVPPAADEYALVNEAFCGVLAQVDLEASGPEEYLDRAVDFVNDKVWGTLSCSMLIHPATDRTHPEAVERAVGRLRYGGVGINVWAGAIYALGSPTWGAYPGHTREEIGSGQGVVHNAFLFDHPQKSVLRARFRLRPKPVWFPGHRTLPGLGRRLTEFEADRSPWKLPGIFWDGIRG